MSQEPGSTSDPHELIVPVVHRNDYTLFYERASGMTFGHIDLRACSPSIIRAANADIETLLELWGGPLFILQPPNNPSLAKISRLLHFKPCGMFDNGPDGLVPLFKRTSHGRPHKG